MATYRNILFFVLMLSSLLLKAQNDTLTYTQLKYLVLDEKTKKPIEFATIIIERDSFKKQKYSDQDGESLFDSIQPGAYNISISFPGYVKQTYQNVKISETNLITFNEIFLISKVIFIDYCRLKIKPKLVPIDEPTHDNFNSKQIMRMPY